MQQMESNGQPSDGDADGFADVHMNSSVQQHHDTTGNAAADDESSTSSRKSTRRKRWKQQVSTKASATGKAIVRNEVYWGIVLVIVAIIIALIALLIYQSSTHSISVDTWSDPYQEKLIIAIVGGVFASIASIITFVQIYHHWVNFVHPPSQSRVIRILFLVPVYGIFAWLSCVFLSVELYFQCIIWCYEAYVVYCFLILLTKYLGGHRGVTEVVYTKQSIPFPLSAELLFFVPSKSSVVRTSRRCMLETGYGTRNGALCSTAGYLSCVPLS